MSTVRVHMSDTYDCLTSCTKHGRGALCRLSYQGRLGKQWAVFMGRDEPLLLLLLLLLLTVHGA
eukprot:5883932-Pyramimonas_sp.AAC.1